MQPKRPQRPTYHTSFVPVYHWYGARPALTDLESHQTGWLVCLSLTRDGDFCVLPLAWEENTPEDDSIPCDPLPTPSLHTQALNATAVSQTVHNLLSAGWILNGRFTIHFTGQDTVPNFQQEMQTYLWQTPHKKEEG